MSYFCLNFFVNCFGYSKYCGLLLNAIFSLQIEEVQSRYLQCGFTSTTNGTNKAALTEVVALVIMKSGVTPTDLL